MQTLMLAPRGIVTEPNKISGQIPVGALTQNSASIVMRSPGIINAAPAWQAVTSLSTVDRVLLFVVGKWIVIFTRSSSGGAWAYYWMDTNFSNTLIFGPISLQNEFAVGDVIDATGRFGFVTVRARSILAASNQLFAWDYIDPASSAQSAARTLGMTTPTVAAFDTNIGTGFALKSNTACLVVAVIRRTYSDGYEIFSAPSSPSWIGATGSDQDIIVQVYFSSTLVVAGDVVEVYRTTSQAYTGQPSTTVNIGADYFLSTSHVLTAAEASAGQYQFTDVAPNQGLGEALYTNTAVDGGTGTALTPPVSKCLAYYRGHTFYANYTEGAAWDVRCPVFWGQMGDSTGVPAAARAAGIGARVVTGNTTSGSPTITSVSAANLVGIVVGQIYNGGSPLVFSLSNVRVTAVGASSITMSANATATATGATIFIEDVVELTYKGTTYVLDVSTSEDLASDLHFKTPEQFSMIGLGDIYPASVGNYALYPIPADARTVFIRHMDGAANSGTFSVRATNGKNYQPQLPRIELSETARTFSPTVVKNGLAWSEADQPEYFCGTNVDIVGRGEIYAITATRDALWVFASDGLWRWSGTGGSVSDGYDWRCDPVDSTLIIAGPQASCVLRDTVFAYTTRGLVSISSDGIVTEISYGRCTDVMPPLNWVLTRFPTQTASQQFDANNAIYLVADEANGEVTVHLKDADAVGYTWVYNVHTDAITRDIINIASVPTNHQAWNPTTGVLYAGQINGTTALIRQQIGFPVFTSIIDLQPIVIDDSFTMRQFLQLEVTFDIDNITGGTVACYFNDKSSVVETRTLSGTQGGGTFRRTSFAVPRNSPAVSNVISARLTINGFNSANYVRFLGAALKYSTPTEQRKDR